MINRQDPRVIYPPFTIGCPRNSTSEWNISYSQELIDGYEQIYSAHKYSLHEISPQIRAAYAPKHINGTHRKAGGHKICYVDMINDTNL